MKRAAGGLDEDFPRGGGDFSEPGHGAATVSRGRGADRPAKRRAVALPRLDEDQDGGAGITARVGTFVEQLKYKNLNVGTKLWGVVVDVSNSRLTVALPSGLRGTVRAAETSDVLAERAQAGGAVAEEGEDSDADAAEDAPDAVLALPALFHPGQRVRCIVIRLSEGGSDAGGGSGGGGGGSRRVDLSLRLSRLHAGAGLSVKTLRPGRSLAACVSSVEDHGYMLSFGLDASMTGFMPLAAAPDTGMPLAPGMLLEMAVTAVDAARKLVTVACTAEKMRSHVPLADDDQPSLQSLLPGDVVTCRVRAVLTDGLVLTFLGLFSGTVDWFHLGEKGTTAGCAPDALRFPQPGRLGAAFSVNDKCKARILCVDATAKKVSLTLRPEIVGMQPPAELPPVGTRLRGCTIQRIDPSIGLLLQLPHEGEDDTSPAFAGYAHISNVSDTRVEKLETTFSRRQVVDARVIGHRTVDGIVAVSLKPSVVDAPFFSVDDIPVGELIDATVAEVDLTLHGGATLTLGPGLKGTVPLTHCSDAGTALAARKLRVGQRVKARVLRVDAPSGRTGGGPPPRVLLTLKPSIVNSKFPALASMADATPGRVAHGCITGIQSYGVFVAFFGDVRGLAHARYCGLTPGQTLEEAYRVGDAIKATVLGVNQHPQRGAVLDLALGASAAVAGAPPMQPSAGLQLLQRLPHAQVVRVDGSTVHMKVEHGDAALEVRMDASQLADSPGCCASILACLRPAAQLGPLLVLATRPRLEVTLKPALLEAATHGGVPSDLDGLQSGALLTGVVANVTPAGVFVRFAQRFTGLAPREALFDGLMGVTPDSAFPVGRTVCGIVTNMDTAAGRFSLSLRPRDVAQAAGCAPLRALLASTAQAEALAAGLSGESITWMDAYPLGAKVACTLAQVKPLVGVLDLDGDEDAVGLTLGAHLQQAGSPGVGTRLQGIVLGCDPLKGLVDIGVRPALVHDDAPPAKGKAKSRRGRSDALDAGQAVTAEVELVKPDFIVVSLPDHARRVCLLQVRDMGECHTSGSARVLDDDFTIGQSIKCAVADPGLEVGRAPLLVLQAQRSNAKAGAEAEAAAAGEAGASGGRLGARSAKVTEITATELRVELSTGRHGRIHVTQLAPVASATKTPGKSKKAAALVSPLNSFSVGDSLQVVVRGTLAGTDAPDGNSMLSLTLAEEAGAEQYKPPTLESLAERGMAVVGYIDTVSDETAWVALAPALRGRLSALDALGVGDRSAALSARFVPGQPVQCYVRSCDVHKRHVDLTTVPISADAEDVLPSVGTRLLCRVAKVVPGIGLNVQCRTTTSGSHHDGRIAITDLRDEYPTAPLDSFAVGDILNAVVVGTSPDGGHLDVSLRASRGCDPRCEDSGDAVKQTEIQDVGEVTPGGVVHGFVKSVTPKGVFVTLGRGIDARVKLSNLADAFIPSPQAEFPLGSRVTGRVLAVDKQSRQVELSLKSCDVNGGSHMTLADLTDGQVVRGTVKRVEPFGVFITLDGGTVTGMCHISQFADGARIKDLQKAIAPGKRVRCKVLSADTETGRLSLGMKASLFDAGEEQGGDAEEMDIQDEPLLEDEDEDADGADVEAMEVEEEEEPVRPSKKAPATAAVVATPARAKPRMKPAAADVLARLMGDGDDQELAFTWTITAKGRNSKSSAVADVDGDDEDPDDDPVDAAAVAAAAKRAKRKEKRAREEALRARERALASGDAAPQTEADFQRLLVSSPDSSYLWIAYMAHLAGLGEPERARAVAERALSGAPGCINYREQREQLNVWVAWMNLEAAYGDEPRPSAVARVFASAVKKGDPKALHLALVGIHQRAGHRDAAMAAAGALTRAFRTSCKAWLRAFALHLALGNGDSARGCLDAAVLALPKRKHAKFLVAAALAEFRTGDAERGRALLEGVLAAQPRRADVWNVYLDAEAKHGGDDLRARSLFQRAVCCGLPPKRCKPLFKKFLTWERAHGDAADVARVKQMAADYVASQVQHMQAGDEDE